MEEINSIDEVQLSAPAKINLGLDVTGVREDGYHELRMVMQSLKLHDRLWIRATKTPGIRVRTNRRFLPQDEENLAGKAARLLVDEFGIEKGVFINIDKHIPASAGLAGGSSDAAAALRGVNDLFSLGLSEEELCRRGVRIGADVPYCLVGGTALAEGIGEKLTSLPAMPPCRIVLCRPPVRVSTKEVYQALDMNKIEIHPDIDGQIEAIRAQDLAGIARLCANVLETVTVLLHPEIDDIKRRMISMGALTAMMSGSGPTVFGIFSREEEAAAAAEDLRNTENAGQVILTEPMS